MVRGVLKREIPRMLQAKRSARQDKSKRVFISGKQEIILAKLGGKVNKNHCGFNQYGIIN
jgi:hypothetical protein